MAVTATPIFPQTIFSVVQQILPADTTTLKTLVTAGANGTRIDAIYVSSTDTSSKDVAVYLTISGTDYLLSTVAIPANSGFTNALPNINLFQSTQFASLVQDSNGNKELVIGSGTVLKVKTTANVTAAKVIQFTAIGGDF